MGREEEEGEEEEEEEGDLIRKMYQRGWLLQTGLVVWDELKWGEDTQETGEENLLIPVCQGDCFCRSRTELVGHCFYSWFTRLFVLLFYICFRCLFNLLPLELGAKLQNQYLHDQERVSPCMCCYRRNIPCYRNTVWGKWWSVVGTDLQCEKAQNIWIFCCIWN